MTQACSTGCNSDDMNKYSEAAEASFISQVVAARSLPTPSMAKAIRLNAGISQGRLAAEVGVHRLTLARWERGGSKPRGDALGRYVHLLDVLRGV